MSSHWRSPYEGRRSPRQDYRPSSYYNGPSDGYSHTRSHDSYGYHPSGPPPERSRKNQPYQQPQYQPPDSGYTFRGVADQGSHYRDFSFRPVNGPQAPSFPQRRSPDRGQPPTKRVARDSYAPPRRDRGPTKRPFMKRGPRPAHERAILSSRRETTPEQLPGMNVKEPRFANVSDVEDEEPVVKQPIVPEAPRWSNPDPYTVLPPVATTAPKKDIVNVIRKAKREAAQSADQKNAVAQNDDFISFDMGQESSSDSGSGIEINVPANAPVAPRAMTQQPLPGDRSTSAITPQQWTAVTTESGVVHIPDHASSGKKRKFHDDVDYSGLCASWQPMPGQDPTPWFKQDDVSHKNVTQPGQRLHEEICDFYEYVRPKPFEEEVRLDLIDRVETCLNNFAGFRQAVRLHAFGSFASGLYLPCADMDLVVLSSSFLHGGAAIVGQQVREIRDLTTHLRRSRIAARSEVTAIVNARVPLIKFTDKMTGIKVDLSFENPSGLYAIQTFQSWQSEYPAMPVIVSLIKQLLAMHEQNEVHSGGFGGFTVICLVVSMLQLMPEMQSGALDQSQHYGHMLQHLLRLYGEHFDIERTGIMMSPPGYYDKTSVKIGKANPERLTIIDPNNKINDISGGSRNVLDIFDIFRQARNSIQSRLDEVRKDPDDADSILGCVWAGNYSQFAAQRETLRDVYEDMVRRNIMPSSRPLPDLSRLPQAVETSLRKIARATGTKHKRLPRFAKRSAYAGNY